LTALGATLPGKLSAETLASLYAAAWCVVTPSSAEGFSMPVIEAAAAGTPSLASDIPAHRALLPPDQLFPNDPAALRTLLESITPARRTAIIDSQRGIAARFTATAVAAALWGAEPAPAILRGVKPKLAFISPLPPTRSGVADYSAATLAALRPLCDVAIFTGPTITAAPYMSAGRYDAVLTVIGNAPSPAYDFAIRYGSAILCHDSRLLGLATTKGLAHAAQLASSELNRVVTEADILAWVEDESKRETPFLSPLSAARPAIFHTAAPTAWLREKCPGTPTHHLPFAIYRSFDGPITPAMRAAARANLGWPAAEKIICSFGFIGRAKGITAALHALTRLPDTRLLFVGADSDGAEQIRTLTTQLALQNRVSFANSYVSESAYRTHLLAADAALQLRESTGNISGALSDCIAAGLPAVATADLAQNLSAPPYITRVTNSPPEIATALAAILAKPPTTESDRTSYCETHSMKNYAANLLTILDL
jgi:glycosyltransferase involved in cell wall biosynthesis